VGGGERAERKRRQAARSGAASKAVQSARAASGSDRTRLLTSAVVLVVLAAAVVGGVFWQRSRSAAPDLPAKHVATSYPTKVAGAVVVAGTGPVTVDLYEDFLCPVCRQFEDRDATKIEQALDSGKITVRYHMVNLLDDRSNPPGYSLESASAALCAAEAGQFPSYHDSLYASQPNEGGRGHSLDALVQLGRSLGITDSTFEQCVRSGTHKDAVTAEYAAASSNPALQRPGPGNAKYFGTPTVVVNGKIADTSNPDWLASALASSAAG
jgi:protein-disulfide isomerase